MNLHISRTKFYLIIVLILLLPLLGKLRLLILGEITEGEVIDFEKRSSRSLRFHGSTTEYAVVQFKTANEVITMSGPPNAKYDFGEKVKVIYLRNEPTNCAIISFSDIYFGLNAVLPAMLLMIWVCLYLSLKEQAARKSMSKS